jgi:hypothetical protein
MEAIKIIECPRHARHKPLFLQQEKAYIQSLLRVGLILSILEVCFSQSNPQMQDTAEVLAHLIYHKQQVNC